MFIMGDDVDSAVDGLPSVGAVKVHSLMCSELFKLVIRVSKIFPELEAARPRCSSGIDALCLLNNRIVKAKVVLRNCSESSALYLSLTGAGILSTCRKSIKLFQQTLSEIRTMVPVRLAAKISEIIIDLMSAEIRLDPSEEEAGRVLCELLHKYNAAIDSDEGAALSAIQNACSRLHICSQKDVLIEKRSIKKMLEKFCNSDRERSKSRRILFIFMDLLKKYERTMLTEEEVDGSLELVRPFPVRNIPETLNESWEASSSSIASMSSSLYDLNLSIDFSNISPAFSQVSGTSNTEIKKKAVSLHETDTEFLSKFSKLSRVSRCNAAEDVKRLLKQSVSPSAIPPEKFVQLILRFLTDAYELHDEEAQMSGCLLLLEFIQNDRDGILYITEDVYDLLGSFLDTQVSKRALSILEALSTHQQCHQKLASSGAVVRTLNILESQILELVEPALKVLSNLSSNNDFVVSAVPLEIVRKLTPLLQDDTFASYCISILKNVCRDENGKTSIAETDGCIASIIKLLEGDDLDNQESAVSILLSLCIRRTEICQFVIDEGIVSSLTSVSVNGKNESKTMAMKLLHILSDKISSPSESSKAGVILVDTAKQGEDTNSRKPSRLRKFFGSREKRK